MTRQSPQKHWRWVLSLAVFAMGTVLAGTVYRWVDEKGQTHYTDAPPTTGRAQEIEISPAPASTDASREELDHLLQEQKAREDARSKQEQQMRQEQGASEATDTGRRQRCVHALAQLKFLTEQFRVYKPGPNDTRIYLEDRDRPAEIDRLQKIAADSCSKEGAARKQEQDEVFKLYIQLGPGCSSDREALKRMQRPEARTPRALVEQTRKRVEEVCPEPPEGLWRRDWVFAGPGR